jgi:hypothetical protein
VNAVHGNEVAIVTDKETASAEVQLLRALKRILDIDAQCDLKDGQFPPSECPGIAKDGMCHWCEARAAVNAAEGRDAY